MVRHLGLERLEVTLTPGRVRAAKAIALVADLAQIAVFPAFSEGAFSPMNDVLDVGVAIALSTLLGWHWAFLPSLVSEAIPMWNLLPTWTAAVLYVTSGGVPPLAGPPSTDLAPPPPSLPR